MDEHDARRWVDEWFKSKNIEIYSAQELRIKNERFPLDEAIAELNCDFIANKPEKSRITLQVLRNALDLKIMRYIKLKHQSVIQTLKYKPDNNNNLEKFVTALIGKYDEVAYQILMHFIWQVKRNMFGFKVYDHLMPILYGATQRQGKSEAVKKLLSPIDGLWIAGKFTDVVDERHAKFFEQNYIMFFDEMRGAKKADVEAIKERITAEFIAYRILFTHSFSMVKNNCTLIGTSNLPLSLMIKDASGMRRFYEIEIKQRCNWNLINSIDYKAIWLGVDEKQDTPAIESVRTQIESQQEENRTKCSVEEWIEEYELTQGKSKNTLNDVYAHYCHFCHKSGLFSDSKRLFGIKLKKILNLDSQSIHGMRFYFLNKSMAGALSF